MADTAIFGVGCAGGRMVNRMVEAGRIDGEFVAINTDRQELEACKAGRKILIGERRFQGRGGAPPYIVMEESAEAVEAIAGICTEKEAIVIVAGLGAGTGTGIAPVVARIAKHQGCRTVAVVTEPLPIEGRFRMAYSLVGLRTLAGVDLLMTVPLGEFVSILGRSASLLKIFEAGDAVVAQAVELLPTMMSTPGQEGREVVDVGAVWALAEGAYGVALKQGNSPAGGGVASVQRASRRAPQSPEGRRTRRA